MPAHRLTRREFVAGASALALATPLPGLAAAQPAPGPDPMRAAEELSRMEVTGHIPALYTFYERLHPDAQQIVPRHVVIRYFTEVFQERDPQPAVATDVTYKDWTWGVNGKTYPNTAEVSFTQAFADGTIEDVVRLVQHDGVWCWFFGRDAAWVEQQIQRFTQTLSVPQDGEAPFSLGRVQVDGGMLNRLPETLPAMGRSSRLERMADTQARLPIGITEQVSLRYVMEGEGYPVGLAQVMTVRDDLKVVTPLSRIVEDLESRPPFTLNAWNLVPGNGVPYADVEIFASDAVGMARSIYWGDANGRYLGMISHVDPDALEAMAIALGGSSEGAPGA